jgi:N-acetylglucosamine kinase-like BadF-type ATPase
VADGAAVILAGIDAGASKSLALLSDGDGRILARTKGAGISLKAAPRPEQIGAFNALLADLLRTAGLKLDDLAHVGLGVSGVDFEDEFSAQKEALAAGMGLPPEKLTLVNDGIVALWGASPSPRSVILQHGSGATAAYRTALGQEKAFDHLDAGGLFDLRVEAIKAARRMQDGRLPVSPLLGQIEKALGVEGKRALSDAWYRGQLPQPAVAGLAALAFKAWTEGDPNAATLVRRAADDYACAGLAMARLSGAAEIHFGGGVISTAPPAFWDLLRSQIQNELPTALIAPPRLGPDSGACLMAAFRAGLEIRDLWDNLERGTA